MSEVKRRLEQKIVDYLDAKAKNSKVTELKTMKPYADVEELSGNLSSPSMEISNLVEDLLNEERIKTFPSRKGKKRYYGSIILPTPAKDVSAWDLRGGTYRFRGNEITINLRIPLK